MSSSGHLALVPALLGWDRSELDAELSKSFEVTLHAGTAAALAIALRDEVAEVLRTLDLRRATTGATGSTTSATSTTWRSRRS